MRAHLRRKRMGRIDHVANAFSAQKFDQTFHAAKPSDALRQGLAHWPLHPSGKGHGACDTILSKALAQGRRFGGSAKDKQVMCDG